MTLMLGDCLERMKEIPDGQVDLVLTDPPYGTTACKWDAVIPFAPMWEQVWRVLKPNGAAVFTASQPFTSSLIASNYEMFKYCWVWEKSKATGHLNAKKQPLRNTEDVVVFYREQCNYIPQMTVAKKTDNRKTVNSAIIKAGGTYNGSRSFSNARKADTGLRYPLTTLRFGKDTSLIHPTQKPVALMEYLIRTYTNESETVLDFTMGSGTTGVACVNTGRNFIGIERDEGYFEIAEKRITEAMR